MAAKILITGQTFRSEFLKILEDHGYEVELRPEHLDEDALAQALQGKVAYILGGVEYASAQAIGSATDLRVIAVMAVGYQSFVDYEAATRKGIAVTNTPDTNTRATAEMTVGLMVALKRKIPYLNGLTKTGRWRDDIISKDLYQETLGIIGMGAIGSLVAEIANSGFGMKVIYYNRSPKPEIERTVGATRVQLEQLLQESDVISLHLPITKETTELIGEAQFRMMKASALLINAARPQLVSPDGLRTALKERLISGCAMDGYYKEPAPAPTDDELGLLSFSDEVLLVSPHLAYLTQDSIYKMCELSSNSVINLLSGKAWKHVVNPDYKNYL